MLQFCVRDTGVGLTEEQKGQTVSGLHPGRHVHHAKIRRDRSWADHLQAVGQLMGGEIWVESEPGKGSEFIFTAKFGLARKVARRHLEPSRICGGCGCWWWTTMHLQGDSAGDAGNHEFEVTGGGFCRGGDGRAGEGRHRTAPINWWSWTGRCRVWTGSRLPR